MPPDHAGPGRRARRRRSDGQAPHAQRARAAQGGRTLHVYPPGWKGPKQEPAFTGLKAAYYGSGLGDWSVLSERKARPGDIILVHAGLYKADRLNYVDPLGVPFDGAYVLTLKGTPERPIVIRAAGDGEPIFDGNGWAQRAPRLFDVMGAEHHIFEGLTIRNTDIAFHAGLKDVLGASGLTVRNCRIEDVGIAVTTEYAGSKDFYIADNVILGRDDRFAGFQAQCLNVHVDFPLLQRIALPITIGSVRHPGIKIHDTRIIRLMEVLLHGGNTVGGWTAKQIHQAVLASFRLSANAHGLNQLRYDLRKLKGHGPLERDGRRYAYRLTTKGVDIALLFLFFHKRLCGPLANSRFHHQPNANHRPDSKLEAASHKADNAMQQIVDLLAAA